MFISVKACYLMLLFFDNTYTDVELRNVYCNRLRCVHRDACLRSSQVKFHGVDDLPYKIF